MSAYGNTFDVEHCNLLDCRFCVILCWAYRVGLCQLATEQSTFPAFYRLKWAVNKPC